MDLVFRYLLCTLVCVCWCAVSSPSHLCVLWCVWESQLVVHLCWSTECEVIFCFIWRILDRQEHGDLFRCCLLSNSCPHAEWNMWTQRNEVFYLICVSYSCMSSGLVVPETKGNETIPEVVTTSGYALLHFFSDAAYNLTGFNIFYSWVSLYSDNAFIYLYNCIYI